MGLIALALVPASAGAAGSVPTGPEVTLRVVTAAPSAAGDIDFEVRVCNAGARPLEFTLPSAQAYDVVVEKAGREVWRWSRDMRFAAVLTPYRLAAGECKTHAVRWEAAGGPLRDRDGTPVAGGDYAAQAAFLGGPQFRSEPVRFSIAPP